MATPPPRAGGGGPALTVLARSHGPHPASASSTRASRIHRPCCPTCWQEKSFLRTGSAAALAPQSLAGGGDNGRQEEGDPVNKPRLNKLPGGSTSRAHALIDIEIRCNPSRGNRALSGLAEKSHSQREGEKLVQGKGKPKRGRCGMERDAVGAGP